MVAYNNNQPKSSNAPIGAEVTINNMETVIINGVTTSKNSIMNFPDCYLAHLLKTNPKDKYEIPYADAIGSNNKEDNYRIQIAVNHVLENSTYKVPIKNSKDRFKSFEEMDEIMEFLEIDLTEIYADTSSPADYYEQYFVSENGYSDDDDNYYHYPEYEDNEPDEYYLN